MTVRLAGVGAMWSKVDDTSGRLEKVGLLADLMRRTPPAEIPILVGFLTGSARQGRMGVGGALLSSMRDVPPAAAPSLELADVDAAFDRLAAASGAGSSAARVDLLRQLLGRATRDEQDFVIRLLFGELRQGALEGVLVDAVARASGIRAARVRRAAMLAGDLAPVARVALAEGETALSQFILQPFQPIQPMLADSAADIGEAMSELGQASLEYKLDGARIQVHKVGDEVRVYSRTLRDVTAAVPEAVTLARAMPAESLVLDGGGIALRENGALDPFQVRMSGFGRRSDADPMRQTIPLTPFFFVALYVTGAPLVDDPLARRVAALDELIAPGNLVPRIVTSNTDAAGAFATRALAAGHEGVMAKAVDGLYAAGRRGSAWLKVKQARTLDLVILAAEWGSGRRRGTLSNLHLGARDAERGGLLMLGKTFKGLPAEMLACHTHKFLSLDTHPDPHTP